MRVSIKLNPQAAAELHSAAPATAQAAVVADTARRYGAALQPMHPGTDDPELRTYFFAEVGDEVSAHDLAAALREHDSVEGAYVKPPDALP